LEDIIGYLGICLCGCISFEDDDVSISMIVIEKV
jgi:hypothetical protein